jgi:hypothetical protein
MAELLIRILDHIHPDPPTDLAGAWKRGFVINIEEDGFDWGRREDIRKWIASGETKQTWHGKTALILIPTIPKADVEYLLESLYDVVGEESIIVRRRSWRSNLGYLYSNQITMGCCCGVFRPIRTEND